jgi:hypothetical protein
MSNRNFGGYITTGPVSANSTSVSGVWTLSQYTFQIANGLWPGSQGYFLFSGNPTAVNEGANTTFFANSTNIPNNTRVYWTIQNLTTSTNDFIETSNSFVISNNTGSFVVRTVADLTTEGSESFQIALRQDSNTGPILVTSPTITLADTSLTPPPAIDVFLVGGGGGQTIISGIPGGGGGGAVLSSSNFTGFQFATSYTVTLAGGSSSSASATSVSGTLTAGPAGLSLTARGGQGGSYFSGGFVSTNSGGNGGGAAAITSSSRFNNQTYLYADVGQEGYAVLTDNDQLQSTYPGIFTYSGFNGLPGVALNSGTTFEMNNISFVAAGGGGGGAGGTFSPGSITLAQNSVNINGRNGLLNSMDNNYYGGGGASYALAFRNQQRIDINGSLGLGGGSTQNSGGGGGSGYSLLTGGSGVAFFKFETSKISASTTGTVTTTTSGIHTIVKFATSGTISFTRI